MLSESEALFNINVIIYVEDIFLLWKSLLIIKNKRIMYNFMLKEILILIVKVLTVL